MIGLCPLVCISTDPSREKDGTTEEHLFYGALYPVKPILHSPLTSVRAGFHRHSSGANSTGKFSIEINMDVQDTRFLKTFGLPDEMQMPNSHLNP